MPSNEAMALNANFEGWKQKRFPEIPKGLNVFEYYCVEQFTRPFDLGDSQLKSGIIGGALDGGVDAFYILANGELVDSETELEPKDPPSFKLLIVQVKSDEGFSPVAVDKFYWFTDDLLDLGRGKAKYHSTYHSDLITLMRLFKDKFGIVVGETPPLSIDYIYVIKKDVAPNVDCNTAAQNVKDRVQYYFGHAESNFKFINAAALWTQVQTRPPKKKMLRWASQPMATQEGDVGLVRLADYASFITTQDEKIEERFFDSNVRGYWPTSAINKKIAETLDNPLSPEFWLLNNGITVLAERTDTTAKFLEIEVHDPQIVNGLQTSRQIFNYFGASQPTLPDNRRVLVRLIKAVDKTVRDEVIRCTNSQNQMPEEALRGTDAIHRQLEQAFHRCGLFYDRRKGYYRDQGKPVDKIVSVIEILQAMLSIVLHRPDDARARPRDYINKDSYKEVFGPNLYPLTLYVRATEIMRRVGEYLEQKDIESIHRRNVNFYLCMYVACEKTSSAFSIPKAIQAIEVSTLTDEVLDGCYARVWKKYERLAERHKVDSERNYDGVAKGPLLLKAITSDLKRRFNKKLKATV